eukprot:EG_transcript_6641
MARRPDRPRSGASLAPDIAQWQAECCPPLAHPATPPDSSPAKTGIANLMQAVLAELQHTVAAFSLTHDQSQLGAEQGFLVLGTSVAVPASFHDPDRDSRRIPGQHSPAAPTLAAPQPALLSISPTTTEPHPGLTPTRANVSPPRRTARRCLSELQDPPALPLPPSHPIDVALHWSLPDRVARTPTPEPPESLPPAPAPEPAVTSSPPPPPALGLLPPCPDLPDAGGALLRYGGLDSALVDLQAAMAEQHTRRQRCLSALEHRILHALTSPCLGTVSGGVDGADSPEHSSPCQGRSLQHSAVVLSSPSHSGVLCRSNSSAAGDGAMPSDGGDDCDDGGPSPRTHPPSPMPLGSAFPPPPDDISSNAPVRLRQLWCRWRRRFFDAQRQRTPGRTRRTSQEAPTVPNLVAVREGAPSPPFMATPSPALSPITSAASSPAAPSPPHNPF